MTLWDGDNMRARAEEAEYVANVEIKTAICNLQARVINASQAAANERHVTVPIETAVTMNYAFGLASAAAGVNVIR